MSKKNIDKKIRQNCVGKIDPDDLDKLDEEFDDFDDFDEEEIRKNYQRKILKNYGDFER